MPMANAPRVRGGNCRSRGRLGQRWQVDATCDLKPKSTKEKTYRLASRLKIRAMKPTMQSRKSVQVSFVAWFLVKRSRASEMYSVEKASLVQSARQAQRAYHGQSLPDP